MTVMRSYLATFLMIATCQGGTSTPVASASPVVSALVASSPSSALTSAMTSLAPGPSPTPKLPTGNVMIAGHRVAVDIASTPEQRRQGLSGRPSLAPDTGLVLAWDHPAQVSIWMPDMNFPIDVVFVRENYVLAVFPDEPPCVPGEPCPTFGPTIPVDFVLEVPAGSAKAWGVKIGAPASYQAN
jgi:hypothetical protein